MDLHKVIKDTKLEIETFLEQSIPTSGENIETLLDAMRYSVLGGGKRLRGILTVVICRILEGDDKNSFPVASAIEMIHAYSLVHDDLPAMDNDDYRRGKLSTHKKYGEDLAILTGDALLTHAFWLIASKTKDKSIVASLIENVSWFSGIGGMVTGQVNDIANENKDVTLDMLEFIHKNKTGALIALSCKCGAIAAQKNPAIIQNMQIYGEKIGLAFQIMDDILDVTSTSEKMGKAVGKDQDMGKNTYPKILGLEKSQQIALSLIQEAKELIADIPNNDFLQYLADYVIHREN